MNREFPVLVWFGLFIFLATPAFSMEPSEVQFEKLPQFASGSDSIDFLNGQSISDNASPGPSFQPSFENPLDSGSQFPPDQITDEVPPIASFPGGISEATENEIASFQQTKAVEAQIRESWVPREPLLIVGAHIFTKPTSEQEASSNAVVEGKIILESKPVKLGKFFHRWVLEIPDGNRIPLTSNVSLLSAIKLPGVRDVRVKVTGKWVQSPFEPRLRFISVEKVEPLESTTNYESSFATESIVLRNRLNEK